MSRRRVLALTALLFMIAVGGFLAGKVIASSGLPNRLGHGLSGAVETGEPKGSLQSSVQTEDPAEPAGTEQPADPGDSGGRGDSGPGQDKPLYWIDVDVTEQRVRIMEGDEAVKEMIASTGVEGHETPLGTFEIQNREPGSSARSTRAQSTGCRSKTGASTCSTPSPWIKTRT